jgi:nitrogen fixation protein FixH
MMKTGAIATQAFIEGNGDGLAAVSGPDVRVKLTTATIASMRASGVMGEFSSPVWSGEDATITVTTGMGVGQIVLAPAFDGSDVVVFSTGGAIGMAKGAMSLTRTWSGWVVSEILVAPVTKPATHPSISTTSTTTTTAP